MHPRVYQEFERICAERQITGSVLEVGATAEPDTLLCMKSLAGAKEKIGIDYLGPLEYRDFKIVQGNANSMDCFPDGRFDVVLSNATFEHDKYFWKSIAEIKRVTKPGGFMVISVPGYTRITGEKLKAALGKIPLVNRLRFHEFGNLLFTGTVTYQVHNFPGDYYRFSEQAMREVILEGMEELEVRPFMLPPRIIGVGFKPQKAR